MSAPAYTEYREIPREYSPQIRRLVAAVIVQALLDLKGKSEYHRNEAREWLETTGAEWLQYYGYCWDGCKVAKWIAGSKQHYDW